MSRTYDICRVNGVVTCLVQFEGEVLFRPLIPLGVYADSFDTTTLELPLCILANHFKDCEVIFARKWWFERRPNLNCWKWHRKFFLEFDAFKNQGVITSEEIDTWVAIKRVQEVETIMDDKGEKK